VELEPELKAMNEVYSAIKDLEDDAKQRVLNWALGKFSLKKRVLPNMSEGGQSLDIISFESVADIFAKASPQSEADKVLVVAAYLQKKNAVEELVSREINNELKNLGHPMSNITTAVGTLINRKPKLMIQTRKGGTTQQAQKKYKVTNEGFMAVQKMISSADEGEI
jgi:hypothetical protein